MIIRQEQGVSEKMERKQRENEDKRRLSTDSEKMIHKKCETVTRIR